jgi:hypothetical protein
LKNRRKAPAKGQRNRVRGSLLRENQQTEPKQRDYRQRPLEPPNILSEARFRLGSLETKETKHEEGDFVHSERCEEAMRDLLGGGWARPWP